MPIIVLDREMLIIKHFKMWQIQLQTHKNYSGESSNSYLSQNSADFKPHSENINVHLWWFYT